MFDNMCRDENILFKNQNYQYQIIITTKIRDNFVTVSSVEIILHKATLGLVTVYVSDGRSAFLYKQWFLTSIINVNNFPTSSEGMSLCLHSLK